MPTTDQIFFFANLAMAPSPGGQPGGNGLLGLLPMVFIFIGLYFFIIAPQRKKQKQHEKMVAALEKGIKVKTTGGLYGTITGVKDDRFVLRVAENVKIEVAKEAISAKID